MIAAVIAASELVSVARAIDIPSVLTWGGTYL